MNPVMNEHVLNDVALVAVVVAFCAVLVVAALWAGAWLRVDGAVEALTAKLSPTRVRIAACVLALGTIGVLLGIVPTALLQEGWFGAGAAVVVLASIVAIAGATRSRGAAATGTAELPQGEQRRAA